MSSEINVIHIVVCGDRSDWTNINIPPNVDYLKVILALL